MFLELTFGQELAHFWAESRHSGQLGPAGLAANEPSERNGRDFGRRRRSGPGSARPGEAFGPAILGFLRGMVGFPGSVLGGISAVAGGPALAAHVRGKLSGPPF